MDKVIITVTGRNNTGIIYRVSKVLAENKVDILDITQTIVQGIFNMMMIVDVSSCVIPFDELSSALQGAGVEMGVRILCQKEEIFDMMHRI